MTMKSLITSLFGQLWLEDAVHRRWLKTRACVFLCAMSSVIIGDEVDIKLHYIELNWKLSLIFDRCLSEIGRRWSLINFSDLCLKLVLKICLSNFWCRKFLIVVAIISPLCNENLNTFLTRLRKQFA